ncbi:pesticin C-terminus-like muramidase [Rodentibacter pneumotropicus]|uniref:pesticin C-terminus-like muramidase n=2 Tax=Rodentibacter pneumotropicus TaxID=758 RepID=UPI0006933702|nr:pesticin C-terminus-like muramidase [Rodentibacter pneumotropicus]
MNKNHQQGYAIEFLGARNEPLAHCYIELSINGYPVSESPLRADEHGRLAFHPSLVEQNGKSLPIKIVFWHEQYPKTVHSEVPEFSWINGKRVVRLRAYNVYEITPRAIPNENNEPATYKRPYHLVKQGETWDVIEKEADVNRYALQWENGLDEATPLDTLVGKKIYFPRGTRKLQPTPKTPSTTSGKSENKQANKKASSVPKQEQEQKAGGKKEQNQVIQARSENNGKPIDTVNKSCPEECKVTEIIIFKTSKGNYIISKELWDFILNIEKYVATPYVPSNGIDGKSGVTLGYGYDLGQQTKKTMYDELSEFYTSEQLKRLEVALGVKGKKAYELSLPLSDITITKENAKKLAVIVKNRYAESVVSIYPGVNDLPKLNHKDPLKVIHFYYFLITMFKSIRFITRF